jgi:hypothetical protein
MVADICEYLVSHGKNGAFGRFAAAETLACSRGERVVVQSPRGLELGSVLCPATSRHARFLHQAPVFKLLRRATAADEATAERMNALARTLFEETRRAAADLNLPVEILDVEVLLDGRQAIIQHLSAPDRDLTALLEALATRHSVELLLENLAVVPPVEHAEEEGCGEPNCGRGGGGSGCSTCGSGGSCSACGASKFDVRAYFSHLRSQMENQQRRPLL